MRRTLTKLGVVAFVWILAGCNARDPCGPALCDCSGRPAMDLEDGGWPGASVTATGDPSSGNWTVDFGQVAVGTQASSTILLTDDGDAPLEVLSVSGPSDAEFSLTLSTLSVAYSCPGDGGILIPITFKPFSAGMKNAAAVITTDSVITPIITVFFLGTGTN
jgi:hypothetical protein